MLTYDVTLDRIDADGSQAHCKEARIKVDSALEGRADAFNPAELLLAAVGACMLKNIERVAPILKFRYSRVHIEVHGERQDTPPRMQRISYRIIVDTDEDAHRLALLHHNVQQFGTVYNTVAGGTQLEGHIERGSLTPVQPSADPS
ncbi:OsmC family protein [Thiomonas sp. FB-Cd]|uniref:OsmC family protein n=1 Tax=Thiomonas sp. FB-Cd TaxID=1158292 RepID=UPI0004DEF26A|nr:OsmC family protein [Thiomonas sp. FB-Cd]